MMRFDGTSRYFLLVTGFVAAILLGSTDAAHAKRGKIPILLQLTHITQGDVSGPKLRSERAENIVFESTGDVLGPGTAPAQPEIFLWDRALGAFSQITDTPGGASYAPTRETDDTSSPRPRVVGFVSTGDFDPNVGNSDGNPEIFLYETLSGVFHQITDTQPPVVNSEPYVSDSGKCVVFASTGDLHNNDGSDIRSPDSGFSNEDGSKEVFQYTIDTSDETFPYVGQFTQVSSAPTGYSSSNPVVGGYYWPRQCDSTAYQSDYDQTGGTQMGTHIYVFDKSAGRVETMSAPEINLLHLPDGNYANPNISSASNFARGPYVVFDTDADVWNNLTVGINVFRYRVFHSRMTQYTDVVDGDVIDPVITDGGKWIVVVSNAEVLRTDKNAKGGLVPPFNPDHNHEIYRLEGRRKTQQITRTENCENSLPSVQDTGESIAFRSTCDLIPGQNPDGLPQIFYYMQVKPDDPILQPGICQVSDACCSEGNLCYQQIISRRLPATRKNCVNKARGC